MSSNDQSGNWWAKVIEAVRQPLGIFALFALILNSVLLTLISITSGNDRIILVIAAMLLFLFLVMSVTYLIIKKERAFQENITTNAPLLSSPNLDSASDRSNAILSLYPIPSPEPLPN